MVFKIFSNLHRRSAKFQANSSSLYEKWQGGNKIKRSKYSQNMSDQKRFEHVGGNRIKEEIFHIPCAKDV